MGQQSLKPRRHARFPTKVGVTTVKFLVELHQLYLEAAKVPGKGSMSLDTSCLLHMYFKNRNALFLNAGQEITSLG